MDKSEIKKWLKENGKFRERPDDQCCTSFRAEEVWLSPSGKLPEYSQKLVELVIDKFEREKSRPQERMEPLVLTLTLLHIMQFWTHINRFLCILHL